MQLLFFHYYFVLALTYKACINYLSTQTFSYYCYLIGPVAGGIFLLKKSYTMYLMKINKCKFKFKFKFRTYMLAIYYLSHRSREKGPTREKCQFWFFALNNRLNFSALNVLYEKLILQKLIFF